MEETKETIMENDFEKDMKQLEDDGLLKVVEIPEVYDATNAKDDPELVERRRTGAKAPTLAVLEAVGRSG